MGAKVPSSSLNGKTLPPGCGWNLNNNNGTATSFTVDTLNQLTAGPTSPYTNDNNANLTGQVNYYAYGYTYDDEDQLTSVIFSGISKSDFKYDGLGRLRQRQEYTWSGGWYLSSTVNYLYDGRRVIQERDGNNTPTVSYTRGSDLAGSLEGAGGIGGLLARSHGYSGGSWSTHNYYHADGGGNITYIMNSSQTMAATYKYDPFGTALAQSGTLASANVYRFSSKEFHSASGLYYYGFRFYDPNLQRWLNRDPIGEDGGINLYAFCYGDAINHSDLFGLDIKFCPEANQDFQNWIKGCICELKKSARGKELLDIVEGKNGKDITICPGDWPSTGTDRSGKTQAIIFMNPINANGIPSDIPNGIYKSEVPPNNLKGCAATLAHELGHVARFDDEDAEGDGFNVRKNENVVREQLKIPVRKYYHKTKIPKPYVMYK